MVTHLFDLTKNTLPPHHPFDRSPAETLYPHLPWFLLLPGARLLNHIHTRATPTLDHPSGDPFPSPRHPERTYPLSLTIHSECPEYMSIATPLPLRLLYRQMRSTSPTSLPGLGIGMVTAPNPSRTPNLAILGRSIQSLPFLRYTPHSPLPNTTRPSPHSIPHSLPTSITPPHTVIPIPNLLLPGIPIPSPTHHAPYFPGRTILLTMVLPWMMR